MSKTLASIINVAILKLRYGPFILRIEPYFYRPQTLLSRASDFRPLFVMLFIVVEQFYVNDRSHSNNLSQKQVYGYKSII